MVGGPELSIRAMCSSRSRWARAGTALLSSHFMLFPSAAFQTEGKLYLILDFLKGGDLFTRLSKEVTADVGVEDFCPALLSIVASVR